MSTASSATLTAADSTVLRPQALSPPTTISNSAGDLRSIVWLLHTDVRELHNNTRERDLDELASRRAWSEPSELLDELAATRGLAWVQIARLVGVSVPALRKWRLGETVSPDNRRELARLAEFFGMITSAPIGDPAAWLELRLAEETTLTGLDIYAARRADLLLELAFGHITAVRLLEEFDPQWREKHGRDERFAVRVSADGNLSIIEQPPSA